MTTVTATLASDSLQAVTIAITTKNRWHDLRLLVQMVQDLGLHNLPFLLIDDGSDEPLGPEITAPLPFCRVARFETSAGLVERRNQLVGMATTDLVLSIDDDSCVLHPAELSRAAQYMLAQPRVAVLAFPIIETAGRPADTFRNFHAADQSIRPIKEFAGGGHLLRRDAFLAAGGYRSFLQFMCEERDLAMRLYGLGYGVHLFPACPVIHWCSPAGRNIQRMNFFRARNFTLIWLLNAPGAWGWLYAARTAAWLLARACLINQYPLAVLSGAREGVRMYRARRAEATPLAPQAFANWVRLLNAAALFPTV
jgi:Glycosyl transferase family 2